MSSSPQSLGPMAEANAPASMDHRRRRALYRATHRGTKELDWLVGRFFEARLPETSESGMDLVEQFLTVADPELHAWIMAPEKLGDSPFRGLVDGIRDFHGLKD
jgi:antitoxin CptB